jgi:hypothetical protein
MESEESSTSLSLLPSAEKIIPHAHWRSSRLPWGKAPAWLEQSKATFGRHESAF